MALDHPRLAEALKRARKARGWSQIHVAEMAEQLGYGQLLSRTTIQRYERATPFESIERVSTTLAAFERVYEWASGSCLTILAGGDPTPAEQYAAEVAPPSPATPTPPAIPSTLPVSVRAALADGETFDYETIAWDVAGTTMHLVIVVKAGAVTTDAELADVKARTEEWVRVKQGIRSLLGPSPDGTSDTARQ